MAERERQASINPRSKDFVAAHARNVKGTGSAIFFINMKDFSEEECIDTLLHELEHHNQEMYLDKYENLDRSIRYVAVSKLGRTPFTEYINPYPCNYDYSQWVKKYGRGCPSVGNH